MIWPFKKSQEQKILDEILYRISISKRCSEKYYAWGNHSLFLR